MRDVVFGTYLKLHRLAPCNKNICADRSGRRVKEMGLIPSLFSFSLSLVLGDLCICTGGFWDVCNFRDSLLLIRCICTTFDVPVWIGHEWNCVVPRKKREARTRLQFPWAGAQRCWVPRTTILRACVLCYARPGHSVYAMTIFRGRLSHRR